jgi:Mn-dependent DtxR family transcriptional regulator
MGAEQIHENVRTLLLEHIETHEQLAAVLLLRNAQQQTWTNQALALELNISEPIARETLEHLLQHGLLKHADPQLLGYRYSPETAELGERVDHLAEAYNTHWIDILKLLSENAIVRVRITVMGAFTDAFVVHAKKEPKRDG